MRVEAIRIRGWRNIAEIEVEIPPESSFVCLVGENGTGKSSILELLTWASQHFGIAPEAKVRRPSPHIPDGGSPEISITIRPAHQDQIRQALREQHGFANELVTSWDGTMTFQAVGWPKGSHRPHALSGGSTSNDKGTMAYGVLAGPEDDSRARFGGACVAVLREMPSLMHLYIDAERVFPPADVRDDEILALSRQDTTIPGWLKQQAAQLTQNLYLEWMRALLGAQQREQSAFYQRALEAKAQGHEVPPPDDPFDSYRAGVAEVLPHLRFERLDQDMRRLIFNSAGTSIPYEQLSGGERELAFLVGQIDRFGLKDGLFLLDEPELHLNAELLRGWLEYLRRTVETGQAWVATHALEAAEVAGPAATLVVERDEDRLIRTVRPLSARPALATLASALGTPAFSLARSRFVLVEGTRAKRERERFAIVTDATVADRFIEAGGCSQVLDRLANLRALASEEEQLRVGGIIDGDFRTEDERANLQGKNGVLILPVHEIENAFLQPELIRHLLEELNREPDEAVKLLQKAADPDAGRWALEKTRMEEGWKEDLKACAAAAKRIAFDSAAQDLPAAGAKIAAGLGDVQAAERSRRGHEIANRLAEYESLRSDPAELAAQCFGKEALPRVARALGFQDAATIESRATGLWRRGLVPRPVVATTIREYLDSIEVLR